MKKCCRCKIPLSDENAGKRKIGRRAGKFQSYCRECGAHRSRVWAKNNRGYRTENLDRVKKSEQKSKLKTKYGLTVEMLDALVLKQGSKCGVCACSFKNSKSKHIDHDHNTGKIRGLLCQRCNMALGLLDDSPERLRAAANYLDKAKHLK